MPTLDPYLFFDGNCADAMRFYEKTLGGRLTALMTHGDSPMKDQCGAALKGRIMHACLALDGRSLMASDTMAGEPYQGMQNFSVSLAYPTADEAKNVFGRLADGGQVQMPIDKTFWADAFGMVKDRFGTTWFVGGGMQPLPA